MINEILFQIYPYIALAVFAIGCWARFDLNPPSIAWYQQQLARVGYAVPQTGELDVTTRHVLAAFQMHFRPALYNGEPDAQSAAILQVLNGK